MPRAELSTTQALVFVVVIVTVLALTKTSYMAIGAMASLVFASATLIYGKDFFASHRSPEPSTEREVITESSPS